MNETTLSRSREPVVIDDPAADKEEVSQAMLEGLQNEPFKKLYADRDSTFLLPASALKIWMFHYRCERENRRARPSLETLCKKLDMNRATVIKWRRWLVDNGWLLVLEEAYRREDGKWSVPCFRVTRPESSPKTAASNPRQYVEFFCQRERVFLLPPSEFKIWLYRLRLEGRKRESWISDDELAAKLGMHVETVRIGQAELLKNGWLLDAGKRFIKTTGKTLTVCTVLWDGVVQDKEDGRQKNSTAKACKVRKFRALAGLTAYDKSAPPRLICPCDRE